MFEAGGILVGATCGRPYKTRHSEAELIDGGDHNTTRERVIAALNHKEPDRAPIILGGSANHLTEERYVLLRDYFGVQDVPRRTLVAARRPTTTRFSTSSARISGSFTSVRPKATSPIR